MTEGPILPKELTEVRFPLMTVDPTTMEIVVGLHVFFDDYKKMATWLVTRNPFFGNVAPLKLIQLGKSKKVLDFIEDAEAGRILP